MGFNKSNSCLGGVLGSCMVLWDWGERLFSPSCSFGSSTPAVALYYFWSLDFGIFHLLLDQHVLTFQLPTLNNGE